MPLEDAWSGTVVKKSRGLLDGSNLYRRVVIRTDQNQTEKLKVARDLWDELQPGDRLVKQTGEPPRKA